MRCETVHSEIKKLSEEMGKIKELVQKNETAISQQHVLLTTIMTNINAIKGSMCVDVSNEPKVLPDLPIKTKEGLMILNENISAIDGYSKQLVSSIAF